MSPIEVEAPRPSATFRRVADDQFDVHVRIDTVSLRGSSRGAAGRLIIHCNDPSDPEKTLPLVGFGKPMARSS